MNVSTTQPEGEVLDLLHSLPAVLAGRLPDPHGAAKSIQRRMGVQLLSLVQQDFVTKARHGVGAGGIRWQELAPSTIERRALSKGDRKALTKKARKSELTPAQQKLYEKEYRQRLASLKLRGLPHDQATALARAQTHNVVRGQGGQIKTRREILGGREYEILRDSGKLARSLVPGDGTMPPPGQIFEMPPGSITVGTKEKAWHHKGIPGKLPARPFWPETLPDDWLQKVLEAGREGIIQAVQAALRRGL